MYCFFHISQAIFLEKRRPVEAGKQQQKAGHQKEANSEGKCRTLFHETVMQENFYSSYSQVRYFFAKKVAYGDHVS